MTAASHAATLITINGSCFIGELAVLIRLAPALVPVLRVSLCVSSHLYIILVITVALHAPVTVVTHVVDLAAASRMSVLGGSFLPCCAS